MIPTNIEIDIDPMIAMVAAAFLPCGRRKACTPSAMASTPVRAAEPWVNARRTRSAPSASSTSSGRAAVSASGQPPMQRTRPVRSVA